MKENAFLKTRPPRFLHQLRGTCSPSGSPRTSCRRIPLQTHSLATILSVKSACQFQVLFNYDLCIIRCRYRIFCKALHDCYIVQHKIQLNSTFSVHDMRIKIKRQNCFNFTLPSPGISSKSCKILNNQISQCKIFHCK